MTTIRKGEAGVILALNHVKAINACEEINRKLHKVDDTVNHVMVQLVTGPGSDDRFMIKWGALTLMDSVDTTWDPAEESLEQYLWDELADWADTWEKLTKVIRKNETKPYGKVIIHSRRIGRMHERRKAEGSRR